MLRVSVHTLSWVRSTGDPQTRSYGYAEGTMVQIYMVSLAIESIKLNLVLRERTLRTYQDKGSCKRQQNIGGCICTYTRKCVSIGFKREGRSFNKSQCSSDAADPIPYTQLVFHNGNATDPALQNPDNIIPPNYDYVLDLKNDFDTVTPKKNERVKNLEKGYCACELEKISICFLT